MSKYFLTWNLKALPTLEGLVKTPYTAVIEIQKEVEFGVWNTVWQTGEYTTVPYNVEVDSNTHRYRVKVDLDVMGRKLQAMSNNFSWNKTTDLYATSDNMARKNVNGATGYEAFIERVIPNVLRPEVEDDMNRGHYLLTGDGYSEFIRFSLQAYTVPTAEEVLRKAPLVSINNSLGTTITRNNGSSIGN